LISSEDDQIRFEQEMAEISAERDAIDKARLTLLEQNQKLKKESVTPIPLHPKLKPAGPSAKVRRSS
jgi:hypothetical protein